jgi:prepilin-type N-terminal cleavage/methylation domain-containing protein
MNQRGFSLIEVLFTLGAIAVLSLGVASGVVTGHKATRVLEDEALVSARAAEFQERLLAIPFGTADDEAASGSQLDELFDEDDVFGTATLHAVRAFGTAQFEVANFPVDGKWRIVVDNDLNGDGTIDTTQDEGRADLLRIAVFFDGRNVAQVLRFDLVTAP